MEKFKVRVKVEYISILIFLHGTCKQIHCTCSWFSNATVYIKWNAPDECELGWLPATTISCQETSCHFTGDFVPHIYSTLHADSPLSAKLWGKFKLCEETRGGHYLGHSQNSAKFRLVDKFPRWKTWTIAIAELALTVKLYWFYWSAEELRGRYRCQSLNIH